MQLPRSGRIFSSSGSSSVSDDSCWKENSCSEGTRTRSSLPGVGNEFEIESPPRGTLGSTVALLRLPEHGWIGSSKHPLVLLASSAACMGAMKIPDRGKSGR